MEVGNTVSHLRAILCDDPNSSLAFRFRALYSLKHLAAQGDLEAIDAIASGFHCDSALLKHELAYCLGQSKNAYAAPYLQDILKDETQDSMVRHEAGEALGALGHAGSLDLLRQFTQDKDEAVAQTCELAIARIEWEASGLGKIEGLSTSAFASIDPAPSLPHESNTDIPGLQSVLNNQDLPLFHRYRAMFRLRDIGTLVAIDALISGFADPSTLFRHEIAFVFGQLRDPYSIPALIKVAANKKEHGMVRHEAVEALGSMGKEEVEELLKSYANDDEIVVRESAVVALDMAQFERSGGLEYAYIPNTG